MAELARRYDMTWKISYRNRIKRMAVLVSKQVRDPLLQHFDG